MTSVTTSLTVISEHELRVKLKLILMSDEHEQIKQEILEPDSDWRKEIEYKIIAVYPKKEEHDLPTDLNYPVHMEFDISVCRYFKLNYDEPDDGLLSYYHIFEDKDRSLPDEAIDRLWQISDQKRPDSIETNKTQFLGNTPR